MQFNLIEFKCNIQNNTLHAKCAAMFHRLNGVKEITTRQTEMRRVERLVSEIIEYNN